MNPVIIGNAELHLCDCMDYMRGLPDKAFELAIVDPPYGIGDLFKGGKTGKMQFNEIVDKGWDCAPSPEYFAELLRVSKNAIVWGGKLLCIAAFTLFRRMGQAD